MDGSKEHPIAPRNAESSLEIMLHLLSMFISLLHSLNRKHVYNQPCIKSSIFDYRCQRGLCRGSPNAPSQHQVSPLSNAVSNAESRLAVTYTKSKGPAPQPSYNPRALPPPELPPRAISPSSTTVSSSWHGSAGQPSQGSNQETSPPRHNDQNAITNPLGRSHSVVMTSNIRMCFEYIILSRK